MAPLLYCAIDLGSPIIFSTLPFNIGVSWIYGYGRPALGISLIVFGLIAGMHPLPRILCIIGCAQALVFDSISAFQVSDYQGQMKNNLAPAPNKYSTAMLSNYYIRDMSSITICTYLLMTTSFASLIMGCSCPQTISYVRVDDEGLDRCSIMKQQSILRSHLCDSSAIEMKTADKASRRKRRQESIARQCAKTGGIGFYNHADRLQELRPIYSDQASEHFSSLTVDTQIRREHLMV